MSNPNGADSEVKTNLITVTGKNTPVADFHSDKTEGLAPFTVQFFDKSQPVGNIANWIWEFGDGAAMDQRQHPTHTYEREGIFTVRLTISNAFGVDTEEKTNLIAVTGTATPEPTPRPTPTPVVTPKPTPKPTPEATPEEPERPCVASALIEESSNGGGLMTLRLFRDNVLSRGLTGVRLIGLYYSHSAEVTDILNADEGLKEGAREVLKGLAGLISGSGLEGMGLDTLRYSIPASLESEANVLIDEIAARGSQGLRTGIKEARRLLDMGLRD